MMDAEVLCLETDTATATNTCSLPLKGPIICSALENSERTLTLLGKLWSKKTSKSKKIA